MYKIIRWFLRMVFRLAFRWEISGHENIPAQGGVIIAANHVSLWDPPVIGCAMSREIHFMAKEELFRFAPFRWLITKLNAFPVRRGAADRTAIKHAMSIVAGGGVLGLFPEGTRSKTGELGRPEPGVVMIAAKGGAVIVPTALSGTNRVFQKGSWLPKFYVKFGTPILAPAGRADKEALDRIGAQIMQEIGRLLKEG